MVNNKTDTGECLVYPGVYRLLPVTEALVKELSVTGNDQGVQVLVNMEELAPINLIDNNHFPQ